MPEPTLDPMDDARHLRDAAGIVVAPQRTAANDDALVRALFDRAGRMDCDVVAASTNRKEAAA